MALKHSLRRIGRRVLPPAIGDRFAIDENEDTAVGDVRFGSFRRIGPLRPNWGFGHGLPVDRHYIESFLAVNAGRVRGQVLEIGDDTYTRRFGGDRVTGVDILLGPPGGDGATIVADLSDAPHIPDARFDAIVCTQTLQLVYDIHAAVATLHRILKPGGTALVTMPGITRIARSEMDRWGDFWRITSRTAQRMFGDAFGAENIDVWAGGNALAAVAFLHGVTAQELTAAELDTSHRDYEVIVAVRAMGIA
jgi:SAM-dependent methyltransferase